jgi:hypothetical protein
VTFSKIALFQSNHSVVENSNIVKPATAAISHLVALGGNKCYGQAQRYRVHATRIGEEEGDGPLEVVSLRAAAPQEHKKAAEKYRVGRIAGQD